MAARDFSQYVLYRWRYVIGYGVVGLLLAGLLLFAGLYLPGALSQSEMNSVVRSAQLSLTDPSTLAISNLPYYALQAGIFALFGVSTFTIKLPSLLLALFSALGLILLLRRWFKPNIAVLASLIAISTGQFLYIAQSGTPSVLYIFWPIVLLLLGTQITRMRRGRLLWKVLFAISAALSLYTPLSIYPLLAIFLAVLFHPHLRNVVRKLSNIRLFAVSILFIAFIIPLVWLVSRSPQLGLTLLGITDTAWPPDLPANLLTLVRQYFMFWTPSTTELLSPVFGLGSALLIILGLYRLIRTRETTRSYLIIFWMICLLPVLIVNPSFTSVTFLPSVLMLSAGLTSLIGYWYRLFPLNPYARIAGLVPIVILVGALIVTGLTRYVYGYHYSPQVVPLFSNDLALLPKNTTSLIVGDKERPFYQAVSKYRKNLVVEVAPMAQTITVSNTTYRDFPNYTISRIITNPRANDSDRWYVMERSNR